MQELPSAFAGFRVERSDFEPAYLETFASGELTSRVEEALEELGRCRVCPRDCDVDRRCDQTGVCKTGRHARVASACPHLGEEDCLRGWNGSGTIFFSFCNLRCVFCQNFDISWQGNGSEMNARQIASLMLELQRRGCHNINFVTPEHVVPQVLESILEAVPRGLSIPIVYNTSGYDSLRSIELLDGVVDIYMPDFKLWSSERCRQLLLAADYGEHARKAIQAMHRQVGDLVVDESGIALRGLLVRHLVLPSCTDETRRILRFLAQEVSPDTYLNIMDQYSPGGVVRRRPRRYQAIARTPRESEITTAFRMAGEAGLHRFDSRWRRPERLPSLSH